MPKVSCCDSSSLDLSWLLWKRLDQVIASYAVWKLIDSSTFREKKPLELEWFNEFVAIDCIQRMRSPYSCSLSSVQHALVVFFLLLQLSCITVKASTKSSVTVGSVVFTDPATHDGQLLRLVTDVRMRLRGEFITLKRRPEQSHCPRPHNYKSKSTQLDISKFDKLLKIEYLKENRQLRNQIPKQLMSRVNDKEIFAVADVQALMSMEQLVRLISGIIFGIVVVTSKA